jgi:AraC-like DNA-binding protein
MQMIINSMLSGGGVRLTVGGFILSADIQTISFKAMNNLMVKRQRSYYEGVLDGKRDNPIVTFFSTNDGTGATFFDFNPDKDLVLSSPSTKESRKYAYFHFMLSSAIEFYGDNSMFLHRFEPGSCSCGFLQTGNVVEVQYKANKFYRYVCIHMDPTVLAGLMQGCDVFDEHLKENDYFSVISTMPIDNIQFQLIRELFLHNAYEGALCNLYRESKLLELICVTVSRFQHSISCPLISLGKKDTVALYKARELLLQDITNPPSLKVLANRAGTNEFKLKKGFKQLFGQTVYGMVHEVRLLEARRLIAQDGLAVQEAAKWVGYKSASHFSSIFKRRFGILPNQLRKQIELV